MDTSKYLLKHYEPEDREALRELFYELWPEEKEKFERQWWWLFERAPLWLVIEKASQKAVGFTGYIPFTLYHQGKEYQSAWMVDFFVLPQHQRKGLGKALNQAVMDQFPITASTAPSKDAWEVHRRMGWSERRWVNRYLFPFGIFPGLGKLLALFSKTSPDLECKWEPITSEVIFDEKFDQLWNRVKDKCAPLAVRKASTLKKRYLNQGTRTYSLLSCFRHQELVGYMILRICPPKSIPMFSRFRVGLIVDFLTDPDTPEIFASMLSQAKKILLKEGAQILICRSSLPPFNQKLIEAGFLHADAPLIGRYLKRLLGGFTFGARAELNLSPDLIWHLTLGDSDSELDWF